MVRFCPVYISDSAPSGTDGQVTDTVVTMTTQTGASLETGTSPETGVSPETGSSPETGASSEDKPNSTDSGLLQKTPPGVSLDSPRSC